MLNSLFDHDRKKGTDWGTIFGLAGLAVSTLGLILTYLLAPEKDRLQALRSLAPYIFGSVGASSIALVIILVRKRSRRAEERAVKAEAKVEELEAMCQALRSGNERECNAFREVTRETHSVHHLLRDAFDRLRRQPRPLKPETLLELQRGSVADACTLIALLFLKLTECRVHVCVSLCRQIEREKNRIVAFPWAYSETDYAIIENSIDYAVDDTNTRFYEGTRKNSEGLTYFHCADLEELEKQNKYRDQTPNWRQR